MNEPQMKVSFHEAILDMGALFKEMKQKYGVPPPVTMDIVRLQMMFMQQNNQPAMMDEPMPEDSDVNEVIEPEADGQTTAFEVIEGGVDEDE